jgi:peptidyl-prolyl cis-trans isomerase B (cyclophilin B)
MMAENRSAIIETEKGTIKIELYEQDAPITAGNFIELAGRNFYDGLTFHRVEPGFVVQGGDPLEVSPKLKHGEAGAVAMARTSNPNSASSQFYITLAPTPFLDGDYAVFGRVVEGMEVVRQLKRGDRMTSVRLAGE